MDWCRCLEMFKKMHYSNSTDIQPVFDADFSSAWRSTEWSECRVDALLSQQDRRRGNQTGLCGGGVQSREVYCVQANAELLSYIYNNKDKQATGICSAYSSQKYGIVTLMSCDQLFICLFLRVLQILKISKANPVKFHTRIFKKVLKTYFSFFRCIWCYKQIFDSYDSTR